MKYQSQADFGNTIFGEIPQGVMDIANTIQAQALATANAATYNPALYDANKTLPIGYQDNTMTYVYAALGLWVALLLYKKFK